LVHDVLERIGAAAFEESHGTLAEAILRAAVPLRWPDATELERLLHECALALLRREGIGMPGFEGLLIESARPLLEGARTRAWPGPGSGAGVLGVEVEGVLELPVAGAAARPLAFKADRVDRIGETCRLVDYKTGRPLSDAKGDDARRARLLKEVASGTRLQAAAYAAASGGEGAYLFLRHDVEGDAALAVVRADDLELGSSFASAAGAALRARDLGIAFPRLLHADGERTYRGCEWCDVRMACLQGDSGARRRLAGWIAGAAGGAAASSAEEAALALWRMGGRPE
jgi:hypothetical protein